MNFNLSATTGAKEAGSVLTAGIHKATFKGISKDTITSQKDGSMFDVMTLTLDVEGYGEFKHNFFEPTNSERTVSQFGENPSQLEHFLIAVRQILDALDPKIGEGIDNGSITISGSFTQVVAKMKQLTTPHIGKEVEIKLIPQSNGFNAIPGFPARISKTGALGIATRFIGHDLTLTPSEKKRIDASQNATPTNMSSNNAADDLLEGMKSQMDDDLDDLPFN